MNHRIYILLIYLLKENCTHGKRWKSSKGMGVDFIVLTVIFPLFAIGSILCSIKYKNTKRKGAQLLQISIIVVVVVVGINIIRMFT